MKNEEYESALKRASEIFNAQEGTPERTELMRLVVEIETHEEEMIPELSTPPPRNDNWFDDMTRFWPDSGPSMTAALKGSATIELIDGGFRHSGLENGMRITFPDGRVLEIDYDWINAWKVIDPPDKTE